jgi:hypothetical protein
MPEVDTIPERSPSGPNRRACWWNGRRDGKNSSLPLAPRSPALPKRSGRRSAGGHVPLSRHARGWLLECLLLIAIIVLPERFASLEIPALQPSAMGRHLLFRRRTAANARPGRRAGRQVRTRRRSASPPPHQTIRVARGDKPAERVVDAPKVNLPHSDSAVANLLAFKPNPGPPPAEGLAFRSRRAHAACDERGGAFAGIEAHRAKPLALS